MHRYNTMPLLNQYSKLASQWTQSTIHLKQFQSHFLRTQFEIQSTTLKSLPIKQTAFSPTHTCIHTYPIAHTYIYIHNENIYECVKGEKELGPSRWRARRRLWQRGIGGEPRRRERGDLIPRPPWKPSLKLSLSHWFGENLGLVDRWLWNQETRRDHQDRREWESQRDSESLARSLDLERQREREREIRCNTCGTHEWDVKEVVGPTIRRYLDFGQGRWFCICLNYKKQPEV